MASETHAFDADDSVKAAREARRARRLEELYSNDLQFRSARPISGLSEVFTRPENSRLAALLDTLMNAHMDRPALGHRTRVPAKDPVTGRASTRFLPEFDTISYGQLWRQVGAIASALRHDPTYPVSPGDFLAVVGFASAEYVLVDLVCAYLGLVVVPLQHHAGVSQMAPIIAEVQPRVLAASVEYLDVAVQSVLKSKSLRQVVIFDYLPDSEDHRQKLDSARTRFRDAGMPVRVETAQVLIEQGHFLPAVPPYTEGSDDRLAMVLYTSGSSGAPKGTMYTERMLVRTWTSSALQADAPVINVNFMPLNHLAGRASIILAFVAGGTSYFLAESDLSTLFEDLALVRPTHLNLVPRVVDLFYHHYCSDVNRLIAGGADEAVADLRAAHALREQVLGGRVVGGLVGTAPLSVKMAAFLDWVLDVHIPEGYGMTEVGLVTRDHVVMRPPVTDYKLVDVPELGYFVTDKPYPRGELLVKSENATSGYYNRPHDSASAFDADGFYRTGDVMAEIGPDQLLYVDRRNNVIKLAQGEFVAIARLETIYTSASWVRQIFVYGNSERSHLLAVVVPTSDALERFAGDDSGLRAALASSLQQAARSADLPSYEIPSDFLIEPEPFTSSNGLLSGVGKALHYNLKRRYGPQLEQLYSDIAKAQAGEIRDLSQTVDQAPVVDILTRAASAVLGTAPVHPDAHFTDLGGDSLSALTFSNLLTDLFGVHVPVVDIIGPTFNLRALAALVESKRVIGANRPTVADVHGANATQIHAAELTLDKFIDPTTLATAPHLPRSTATAGTVLLTGANGWLGRFLTLAWLRLLSRAGGTLIAIVRGRDVAEARRRLRQAFDSGDPALLQRFDELAARHLQVLPGDVGERNLGLDPADWTRLAHDVDLVVHAAALVNHLLPYSELFGPNVVGTAELIRLSLTTRIKPITYVSTMAVGMNVDPADFTEDGDIRNISPARLIADSYASGYANSKWAGEVLLREAHDLASLPVTIFRSDRMLAHTHYCGQLSMADMFTRLLMSLLATGIAPASFYTGEPEQRARAHYSGLPVDFVADVITSVGTGTGQGFRSFNVVNPHDDGVSLDTIVDWLIASGHPVTRIDDYGAWLARFETALRALPEELRRMSVLPLLGAYTRPQQPISGVAVSCGAFSAAVRAANVNSSEGIPHLTPELIGKHVTDLELRGLPVNAAEASP
jgi:fatty acid CoA ligase FadD9